MSSIGTVEPVESLTTPFLPLFHYDSFITDSNGDSGNYIFTQADGTNNPWWWYHRTKRNGVWETLDENKFAASMFKSRANTSNTLGLTVDGTQGKFYFNEKPIADIRVDSSPSRSGIGVSMCVPATEFVPSFSHSPERNNYSIAERTVKVTDFKAAPLQ